VFAQSVLQMAHLRIGDLKKIIKDLDSAAADSLLDDFREISFLGRIVPSLASFLFLLSSQGDLLPQLVSDLMVLIQGISKLTPYSENVAHSEARCLGLSKQFTSFRDSKVVETRHPYKGEAVQAKEAIIPGARYLLIKFDPRCEFSFHSDQLTLFSDRDQETQIGTSLFYSCPKEMLFVPGDSIYFKFEPTSLSYKSKDSGWGYECQGDFFVCCCCCFFPVIIYYYYCS
jgi:hypothetical protein